MIAVKLESLDPTLLEEAIKTLIDSGHRSVILSLIQGEILVGDFHPSVDFQFLPVALIFNTREGKVFGHAHVIQVPPDYVSGIRPLVWTRDSLSELPVKWIPNPLATLICDHNLLVAEKYGFDIWGYREMALPQSGVPSTGIEFEKDELIYVDWEFFSRIKGGSLQVGVQYIGFSPERSLLALAHDKLRIGPIERLRRWFHRKVSPGEYRIEGFVVAPEHEVTTQIEGQECIVMLCTSRKVYPPDQESLPVILKRGCISYPVEFFPFLNSRLVFYGELKQIPIAVDDIRSERALLARAIGYIPGRQDREP